MGAGVAKGLRARFPEMYEEYRSRCKAEPRRFNLGDCWLWKAEDRPWVFNLGTQEGYWRTRASYEAIETALRAMRQQADDLPETSLSLTSTTELSSHQSSKVVQRGIARFTRQSSIYFYERSVSSSGLQ